MPNQSIDYFNDKGYSLVTTATTVYIQTQDGYTGEVVYPPIEDNKIGPNYNRTAFYFSQAGSIKMLIMFRKLSYKKDYKIHLRTTLIENLYKSECDDVIVFNKMPNGVAINDNYQSYIRMYSREDQKVCIFPAVPYYFLGSYNEKNLHIYDVYGTDGYIANYGDTITDDEYNKYINYYSYYGHYTYTTLLIKDGGIAALFAFLDTMSEKYPYYKAGVLDEEPYVFYNFQVNHSYGIHTFGKNYLIKDEPTIEYEDIEYTIDKVNVFESFNFTGVKKLSIHTKGIAFIAIHSMKGLVAKFYHEAYNPEYKFSIYDNETDKIVYFGNILGLIEITRIEENMTLWEDSNETFVFSAVSIADVLIDNHLYYDQFRCKNILISTEPKKYYGFSNRYIDNSTEYNYTISDDTNELCLWFAYPIKSKVVSHYNLSFEHWLYVNNTKIILDETNEFESNNFLYILKKSAYLEDFGSAIYQSNPLNENDILNIEGSYMVTEYFQNIEGSEISVLGPKDKSITQAPSHGINKLAVIITIVIVVVIVIIVVIVITVVCVKKKKKKVGNSNDDDSCQSNLQNETATQTP